MKAVLELLNNLASTTSNLIEEGRENLEIYSRVGSAMRESELAFHAEKGVINLSIEIAESKIEVEKYMSQSEEHKRGYLDALEDVRKARGQKEEGATKVKFTIPQFLAPSSEPIPKINKSIENSFQNLKIERKEYFDQIRHRLLKGVVRLKPRNLFVGIGFC